MRSLWVALLPSPAILVYGFDGGSARYLALAVLVLPALFAHPGSYYLLINPLKCILPLL